MSEAFRRRQLFSFQCCAAVSLSLQNSFPIKARNENKGRNIRRQAVSIKPHSRLTNKVGVAEKQPNASLSQYLNVLDKINIECQCYCYDLCVVLFRVGGYLTSSWSSPGEDSLREDIHREKRFLTAVPA